jgi:hypothetical protein
MESIDRLLHAERVDSAGHKTTWAARLGDVPDGAMAVREGTREPLLVLGHAVHSWTPAGYGPRRPLPADTPVQVLTPRSVVRVLARGYRPVLHPSVSAPVAVPATVSEAPARPAVVSAQPAPRATPATPPTPVKAPSPVIDVASVGSTASGRLYRLEKKPAGNALYTYFAAILIATGMDKSAVHPLKKFLKNFSGHEQAGRIEKAPGGYRLTRAGRDYFADRFEPGSPQRVMRHEVDAMVRLIRTGQAPGWVAVD